MEILENWRFAYLWVKYNLYMFPYIVHKWPLIILTDYLISVCVRWESDTLQILLDISGGCKVAAY